MSGEPVTDRSDGFFIGPDEQPDRYRLLRQVGGGGEAQLWQADLPVAGGHEPVAVKVLRPDMHGEFARLSARWAEQAEVLRFVRHPGVVGVREHFEGAPMHPTGGAAGASGRSLYLVMNWVEGQQLRDFVTLGGGSREATLRVLRHLEQVADILDWLHSGAATPSGRSVVHGDLSTGNVMITPTGQAVLVDFGLARLAAHQTQQAAGTPGYAAPEVWLSGRYSPASDRYGFGSISYFALTGRNPPFDRAEIREGFRANPLLASADPQTLDQVMDIFADDPRQRPAALRWIRLLRDAAATTRLAALAPQAPPLAPARTPAVPADLRPRGRQVAAGIGAALVVGVLVGAMVFGGRAETQVPRADADAISADVPAAEANVTPAIRRETGAQPIRLTDRYSADLDSVEPDWGVTDMFGGDTDVRLQPYSAPSSDSLDAYNGAEFAPVEGGPDLATCERATEYYSGLQLDDTAPGYSFCARTNGGRYAFVTILDPAEPVQLDVVVWEKPQ